MEKKIKQQIDKEFEDFADIDERHKRLITRNVAKIVYDSVNKNVKSLEKKVF